MKTVFNTLEQMDVADDETRWADLREKCPYLSDWGLRILKSGLAAHTGTILIEGHYVCKDHRNLFSNFYSKKLQSGSADCCRLHFFSAQGITDQSFYSHPKG